MPGPSGWREAGRPERPMLSPPGPAVGHGLWSPAGTACPWWDIWRAWWSGASLFAVMTGWFVSQEQTVCPESPTPGHWPSLIGQLWGSSWRGGGAQHRSSRGHRPRESLKFFRAGLEGKNYIHNHPKMLSAVVTVLTWHRWADGQKLSAQRESGRGPRCWGRRRPQLHRTDTGPGSPQSAPDQAVEELLIFANCLSYTSFCCPVANGRGRRADTRPQGPRTCPARRAGGTT